MVSRFKHIDSSMSMLPYRDELLGWLKSDDDIKEGGTEYYVVV
jgi:hypothetical protein